MIVLTPVLMSSPAWKACRQICRGCSAHYPQGLAAKLPRGMYNSVHSSCVTRLHFFCSLSCHHFLKNVTSSNKGHWFKLLCRCPTHSYELICALRSRVVCWFSFCVQLSLCAFHEVAPWCFNAYCLRRCKKKWSTSKRKREYKPHVL